MKDKSTLREYFLGCLKQQGSLQRQEKSLAIAQKLYALEAYVKAKTVLFYASLPSEVETFAMMRNAMQTKKTVAVPVIDTKQKSMVPVVVESLDTLRKGSFGILEPKLSDGQALHLSELDAVIIPGLAFDKHGARLGRGAGFYDRFLSSLDQRTTTIGLAFDFQVVDCLPTQPHDVAVDCILSA